MPQKESKTFRIKSSKFSFKNEKCEICYQVGGVFMTPLVSIVVPAYNSERTIGSTIQSILNQTFTNLEVIVVDDGSKDNTIEIAKRFGDRVRCFSQGNKGAAAARNRGLFEAQGHYVAFLDSDDLWLPNKLEIQVAVLEKNPNIDAVQCSVYLVNDQLQVVGKNFCNSSQDSLLDFLLFRNLPGIASTLLIRREKMLELKGFGEDLVILEDWDFVCRLARKDCLKSLSDFLVLYRQHPENRSRNVGIHVQPGFTSLDRLFSDPCLEADVRKNKMKIWGRFFSMLAAGYFRNREWKKGFYWALRALRMSPGMVLFFLALPLKRLRQKLRNSQDISFADVLPFAVSERRNS